MANIGKIRPASSLPPTQPTAIFLPESEVRLSFKYFASAHAKFRFADRDRGYFLKLLDRFKDVCALTPMQMRTSHKEVLRCHSHDWKQTSERNGFGLRGQLADCEGWQFQLTSNAHGRVHGFFVGTTFFVVWLDPEHLLYP